MTEIARRLQAAVAFLVLVVLLGTTGIHQIGGGRWTWGQCLYHTIITISTVGFGELPGMENSPWARAFTVALVVFGAGSVVYFLSVSTALVVEGELRDLFRQRRMSKTIDHLSGHVIVCGVGRTGQHVIEELHATHTPFVAVDSDAEKLRRLHDQYEKGGRFHYVVGDATDDDVMRAAGIARAKGLVSALDDDKANLFATLTARSLNPTLRIIAKMLDAGTEPKMRRAGADKVVSPNIIGGMRLASEMIRPNVTEFLDQMLHAPEHVLRIEEAVVGKGSVAADKTLGSVGLRKICDVLVVAVRSADGKYRFNPGAETLLEPGATLIVLGERTEIVRLRAAVEAG